MANTSDRYAKIVPLYRSLNQRPGGRETEDERLRRLRYPPNGDPAEWVRNGPDGEQSRARNWHGQLIRGHEHRAAEPGLDCLTCGFPWWPDSVSETWGID